MYSLSGCIKSKKGTITMKEPDGKNISRSSSMTKEERNKNYGRMDR